MKARIVRGRARRAGMRMIGLITTLCMMALMLLIAPPHAQAAWPTTYRVDRFDDVLPGNCNSGNCSLRQAITLANANPGHDTIILPDGIYTLSMTGDGVSEGLYGLDNSKFDLDITDGVTITGSSGNRDADPNRTIIRAGLTETTGIDRIFHIGIDTTVAGTDGNVTIEAVTLRYGKTTNYGGAIYQYALNGPSQVYLYNCIITQNTASKDGGGIDASTAAGSGDPNQLFKVEKTLIRDNEAGVTAPGTDPFGGTVTGPGTVSATGGLGGGMIVGALMAVQILDSRIEYNKSHQGTNPISAMSGDGGGLYVWDATGVSLNPSFVRDSIIADNQALDSDTSHARGGGAYIGRAMKVTNTTVTNNHADKDGGGLYVSGVTGSYYLANLTVSGNNANGDGAGLMLTPSVDFTLVNLTVTNNRSNADGTGSTGNGGGLYRSQDPGAVKLFNSIIAGNVTGTGTTASDVYGYNSSLHASSVKNIIGTGGSGGLVHNPGTNWVGLTMAQVGLDTTLQDNGSAVPVAHVGARLTHALLSVSPALDGGDNTYVDNATYGGPYTTDGRGTNFDRKLDAGDAGITDTVDIGALEMHPAIEDIQNLSVLQDPPVNPIAVQFHIGDVDKGFDSVTPSLISESTPGLIVGMSISGSGDTRTLNVTPGAGKAGTATIRVTVTSTYNGKVQTMYDDFVLTVVPRPNLSVVKSHTGNFRQGDKDKPYTIKVNNTVAGAGDTLLPGDALAPAGTTVVTVTDTLPTGLTPAAAATKWAGTNWTCTIAGQTYTCTYSQRILKATSAPDLTIYVDVDDSAGTPVLNPANVSGGGDNTPGNNGSTDTTNVTQTADLTVSSSHTDPFERGQNGRTYTLTVSNVGPGPTDAPFQVVDTLPTGLTPTGPVGNAGDGWTCSIAGQTVTCNRSTVLSNLAGNNTSTITVTVNVALDAATSAPNQLTNAVTVSGGGELASRASNNSGTDLTNITQKPDLTVTKAAVGTFRQGRSASYTITVTNSGFATTSGTVTVTDTLPAGLTYTGFSGTGWTCSAVGQDVTCTTSDTQLAGQPFTPITINMDVAGNAGSPVVNTAHVTGGGQIWTANDDSAAVSTVVVKAPDLSINKSHTDPFTQGETGRTYDIVVTNKAGAGPTFETVNVTDTLPTGLTPTGVSGGADWTCDPIAVQTVTCHSDTVKNGGESFGTITITVDVSYGASTPLVNTAVVSGGGELNTTTGDNSDPDSTTVIQLADLKVTKSDGGVDFQQGQSNATYTITVENVGTGSAAANAVSVTDVLAIDLDFVSATGAGWTCTYNNATRTVTCSPTASLAVGSSSTITLLVDVAPNATYGLNALSNTATASVAGDTDPSNDSGSDTTTVIAMPDLTVSKTADGTFRQGQNASYTITAKNSGFATTSGTVTVVDTLPAGLTYVSATMAPWNCTAAGQVVTCTTSETQVSGNNFTPLTINVSVAGNANTSVTNNVKVSGGGQIYTANDGATTPTTVVQAPNLTIDKSHSGTWTQGDTGKSYSIVVTNAGPGPTFGEVTVTDTVPTGLTPSAATGAGWTCSITGQTFTCKSTDQVAATAPFPAISLTVDVATTAAATVTNSVSVSGGSELPGNTGNNAASDLTNIVQRPDLIVDKRHTGAFQQGGTGSYTIVVTNQGTGVTSGNIVVSDTFPAGLTPTGWSSTNGFTCTLTGQAVSCTRSTTMIAGASATITINVSVARDATDVINTASVSGGSELPAQIDNNADSNPTAITLMPDLQITKAAGTFRQGQQAEYTLTVKNAGFAPTTGAPVIVKDVLNANLTYVIGTGSGWTCTYAAGTREVTCSSTDIVADTVDFPPITITVGVAGTAPTSLSNTASVDGGGQIWKDSHDSASVTHAVIEAPDLTIDKSHSGTWTQGDSGKTYSIVVSNAGPGPTFGEVTVTDTLPTGLTPTAASGTGWTCDPIAGQTVTCNSTDQIASGGSFPAISLTVDVATTAAPTVTNTATVSGGSELSSRTGNNSAPNPTDIVQLPDLIVNKSHVGNFAQGQVGAKYSVVVKNQGTGLTSGTITVTDTLPGALTPTSATADSRFTCSIVGQTVTCTTSAAMATNDQSIITITVNVSKTAPTTVTNTASVAGGGEQPAFTGNNSSDNSTTIAQKADLTVTKSHSGNFRQGQVGAQYSITVSNNGTADTDAPVTMTDTLPTGLTPTAASGGATWNCGISGQTVTCTTSAVRSPGQSYPEITVTVNVGAHALPSLTNTASVSGGGEVVTDNNTGPNPTTIVQIADLTIAKSHSGDFTQGQSGKTYSITVTNVGDGPSDAPFSVSDTVPAGLTPTAAAGTDWACSITGQTVACNRSAVLSNGNSSTITLTVNVAANAPISVTNTATVSGGGEVITNNNSSSNQTTILQLTSTTLQVVNGQYSDKVTFTATVQPVVPGSVQFSVATLGVVGSAPVNTATGKATFQFTIPLAAGSYDVVATYQPTDTRYLTSNSTPQPLTVTRENTLVLPAVGNPAVVPVAPGTVLSPAFTLSATIRELPDGSAGDIGLATPVTFRLIPILGSASSTCTATTSGGGVGGTLTASCTFSNLPVDLYLVEIKVGGNYYTGTGFTAVAVYAVTGGSVSGQGTVKNGGVSGTFGFSLKYGPRDTVLGSFNYMETRAGGSTMQIRSAGPLTLSVSGKRAVILGRATINGTGDYLVVIQAIDNGAGTTDQFALRVSDSAGNIVADLTFGPTTLSSGDIKVPPGR